MDPKKLFIETRRGWPSRLVCAYGDGGIVQAVKLPEATKQCGAIYGRVQDPLVPRRKLIDVLADIVCKQAAP